MDVKKIATLNQEEVETLKAAGKLLKTILEQLETNTIDSLIEQDIELLKAIGVVVDKVCSRIN